jgi:predicted MFS family arabinose efflux permease
MSRILLLYRNAYGGLSQAAWMLALVMFVNRCGAMVVPFLSVYLTEALDYSLRQTGIVMSVFGLGAMGGSFLGGWLTDRIGHFRVQFFSLVLGGSLFFVLVNLSRFEHFAVGIFLLSLFTECLRPANASSVSFYAKPENVTRAFSLNRMAINLGFSIGPALGGLLAAISYQLLFLADGFTCMVAGLVFFLYFRHRKGFHPKAKAEQKRAVNPSGLSPYRDLPYLLFVFFCLCFAVTFFQFFTTLPLYYRQAYSLSEQNIGLLLGMNGLVVFLFEMIFVYLVGNRLALWKLIVGGLLLLGISFFLLNLFMGTWVLYLSMLLLSFSEILAMPFMATLTVQRSNDQNRGAYMGLYSLSYSAAFVLAPYLGTSIIAHYGFAALWWASGALAGVTAVGFWAVTRRLEEKPAIPEPLVAEAV